MAGGVDGISQEWWDRWWAKDWSWEGLAKKPWRGWVVPEPGAEPEADDEYDWPGEHPNLAQRFGPEARPASLQDYWRDQEDSLQVWQDENGTPIKYKGRTWAFTKLHLPFLWPDNAETPKANWEPTALNALLNNRMNRVNDRAFMEGLQTFVDWRAQLQGGVILEFDVQRLPVNLRPGWEQIKLSICCEICAFAGDTWFSKTCFAGRASFDEAAFSALARFDRTTFVDKASFERVTFAGEVRFDKASFARRASFRESTFDGAPLFREATFVGDSSFDSANFAGHASFHLAIFGGPASFDMGAFDGGASFEEAAFDDKSSFDKAAFAGASFQRATFERDARFRQARFAGDAWFHQAAFAGDAWFQEANFIGSAHFYETAFVGDAWFYDASFAGYTSLDKSAFAGDAQFSRAAFSGDASFQEVVFAGDIWFTGKGTSVTTDSWKGAVHIKALSTTSSGPAHGEIEFPEQDSWIARRSFPTASFRQAVFMGSARFDNRDFLSNTSFTNAIFLREAEFHDSKLHRGISFRDTQMKSGVERGSAFPEIDPQFQPSWDAALNRLYGAEKRAAEIEGKPVPEFEVWTKDFTQKRQTAEDDFSAAPQNEQSAYFGRLEDCYRTLKQLNEDKRDRGQEARFFKLELKARRKRRDRHVKRPERLASDVYGAISDFGTSPLLPLGWLAGSVFVFALLYWMMGTWFAFTPSWQGWGDALSFSFGRVLPVGPWSEPDACGLIGRLLDLSPEPGSDPCAIQDGVDYKLWWPGTPIWIRLIASFQSLSAIVLVFLSGLAVRRKFQIN
ncbi:pentapeptide repeat-containing protein [Henriciella marina]|uniref:pentapeptide repeat-containing protein n=1 Tax=Henriciella marina TaxID=453851 RepID=UPI00036172E9|nr:pentapeptide repeat-containing protein [Henriciella marina]